MDQISGVLYADSKNRYHVEYVPDVIFAHRKSRDLRLQLLLPEVPDRAGKSSGRRYPLIVFTAGSGWTGSDSYHMLPQIVDLAHRGYVVASIEYQGTFRDDVRFPAAIQDTKEAIRFLRAHAEEYFIDPARVGLLGDSSGGHTAAGAALTAGESRFDVGGHLDQSSEVSAVALFYAPVDLMHLVEDRKKERKKLRPGEGAVPFEAHEIFQQDYERDPEGMLADASPIGYLHTGKRIPPVLFLQGDDDEIIPMAQGLRFCQRVRECGGRAEFFKIAGGRHGTGCWFPESINLVGKFFDDYI